ncbi:hypothetical protein SASPL_107376 [Salvia splendens]|uniref:CCT domain-containing protein n=1 Tax=Salvia splendens TaxID=180675 RepID=A0A8X9A590_SALSN|nr:hypothetical protein SASPL_107376 [Salvia splendens]
MSVSIISSALINMLHSLLQIWDFNLGQLRGREESSPVELEFGRSDMYTMKSYGELLKEASLAKRRVVVVSGVNCSVAKDTYTMSAVNNHTPSQGPATSESNNVPVSRPPCSALTKPETLGGLKDVQFTSQSILLASESVAAIYDKHIRYESRKARADTRKRVKGRFVKAHEAPACEMKKGLRKLCIGEGSTSILEGERQPTLEEMILRLEMESGKSKVELQRMSCVSSCDILRSARKALDEYPRFSLDGKEGM